MSRVSDSDGALPGRQKTVETESFPAADYREFRIE